MWKNSLLILITSTLISGCGYKVTVKRELPIGVDKVFVEIFKNKTHEVGLESFFTNKFIGYMARYLPLGTISKTKDNNSNIIEGEITSLCTSNIFYDESHPCTLNTNIQHIVVTARVRLKNSEGLIIRSTGEIKESHDYDSIPDDHTNHSRRQEAIFAVIEKISKSAFYRLTENF